MVLAEAAKALRCNKVCGTSRPLTRCHGAFVRVDELDERNRGCNVLSFRRPIMPCADAGFWWYLAVQAPEEGGVHGLGEGRLWRGHEGGPEQGTARGKASAFTVSLHDIGPGWRRRCVVKYWGKA